MRVDFVEFLTFCCVFLKLYHGPHCQSRRAAFSHRPRPWKAFRLPIYTASLIIQTLFHTLNLKEGVTMCWDTYYDIN